MESRLIRSGMPPPSSLSRLHIAECTKQVVHRELVEKKNLIFVHPDIDTPINAQKKKDGTTKAYQVKQAIQIIDGD